MPTRQARSATPSAQGPLTLAQARALLQARAVPAGKAVAGAARKTAKSAAKKVAKKAAKKVAKKAAAKAAKTPLAPSPATPTQLAAERRRLRVAQRQQQRERVRDYRAVMTLLQRHGLRGLAVAPAAAPAAGPLRILAEGDSWFDYPVPFFGGGIVPRLEDLLGVPILNLAKAGDEVRFMLGVEEREVLAQQLSAGSPAGGAWDVLLFSGGGNDIVGNPLALWLLDHQAGVPPAQLLNQPRYDAALALVRAGYEDLIALRDRLSPDTQLVFHAYDFALPDGRGLCGLGPWLKPALDQRGFPTLDAGFQVVRQMLMQFAAMLAQLQAGHPRITLINGQGTLQPVAASWHNELHPARAGFRRFADIFAQQLRSLFPLRVPAP